MSGDQTTSPSLPGSFHAERTKELYKDLLSVFDKLILPTHASGHVQYTLFYLCSFKLVSMPGRDTGRRRPARPPSEPQCVSVSPGPGSGRGLPRSPVEGSAEPDAARHPAPGRSWIPGELHGPSQVCPCSVSLQGFSKRGPPEGARGASGSWMEDEGKKCKNKRIGFFFINLL